jgi:predicted Zn-dependent peptidase
MRARKQASLAAALSTALAVALSGCATAGKTPAPGTPATTAQPGATAPAAAGQALAPLPVPPLGPPVELRLPAQQKFRLSNGLAVRLVESRKLPIVAVHLVLLEGGSARDPADLPGVASFTAAMVTEGTRTRSAIQISDEIGYLGASLGAGASMDAAYVSGYGLSRHLPKLLELLADVAMNPAFPTSDFARVQDQRKVALLQQKDQPGAMASKAFGKLFWGDHPYGHWSGGTEESVARTTREDLARFHAAHWRPGAAELVVVGDVDRASLEAGLERAFAGWKGDAPASPAPPESPAGLRRAVLVEKASAPQTFLILGMPGMARSDPDLVAAQVLFQVLGGGSSSRLFRDLREEKGYTYGLSARESAQKQAGASYLGGSVRADATGQAIRDLLDQVKALRDVPVPGAELDDARDALVRSLPGDFATVAGIAGRVAEQVVHGLPDDYWSRYPGLVRAVTAEDVQRVATRYLDPAKLTTVMVGDPAVVRPQLEGLPLGDVEVRQP